MVIKLFQKEIEENGIAGKLALEKESSARSLSECPNGQ